MRANVAWVTKFCSIFIYPFCACVPLWLKLRWCAVCLLLGYYCCCCHCCSCLVFVNAQIWSFKLHIYANSLLNVPWASLRLLPPKTDKNNNNHINMCVWWIKSQQRLSFQRRWLHFCTYFWLKIKQSIDFTPKNYGICLKGTVPHAYNGSVTFKPMQSHSFACCNCVFGSSICFEQYTAVKRTKNSKYYLHEKYRAINFQYAFHWRCINSYR